MVHVFRSTRIAADPARAWALVRDFDAMPTWNAATRSSRIENGPADRVGCLRVLEFDDGGTWTHQLTGLSDEDRRLQYRIVGTPEPMRIPVWNYRAEMRVLGADDGAPGACIVEWRAAFETAHEALMVERAGQVFEQGFEGLGRCLEQRSSDEPQGRG